MCYKIILSETYFDVSTSFVHSGLSGIKNGGIIPQFVLHPYNFYVEGTMER
jgi:hypothetical protein